MPGRRLRIARGRVVTSGLLLEPVSWLVLACMIKLEQCRHNSPSALIPFRRSQPEPAPVYHLPVDVSSLETLPHRFHCPPPPLAFILSFSFVVSSSVHRRRFAASLSLSRSFSSCLCNPAAIRNFTTRVLVATTTMRLQATSS